MRPSSTHLSDPPRRVLVIGATGKTGSRAVRALDRRGIRVRAASRRSPLPAERFDWHDDRTWRPALRDVDAVYVTYQPDLAVPGAADAVGALAEIAAREGVTRLVLLSGRGEPAAAAAEAALLAEAPGATVLRCSWFDQNFSEGALRGAVEAGALALPAPPDRREPFLDADDIAECVVAALTDPSCRGEVVELTGPESLTMTQVCGLLAEAAGRPVTYAPRGRDEFARDLAEAGMPAPEAAFLAGLFAEVLDGRNSATTDGVARLLGRPGRSFAAWAHDAALAGTWRAPGRAPA
ncbi:NmrA family NAD(P)-binding protein [Micromonospora maritima]|uniref:NmrA family NAD(P)-binding protein n=1 Tax=Micromonospora maritima TaxID=986711 RepID=UPI0037B766D4